MKLTQHQLAKPRWILIFRQIPQFAQWKLLTGRAFSVKHKKLKLKLKQGLES